MRAAPDPLPTLPETADALRALLLAAWAERDSAVSERDRIAAERDALASQNDRLRHLLLKLKRMQFGARSERLPEEQESMQGCGVVAPGRVLRCQLTPFRRRAIHPITPAPHNFGSPAL